MSNNRRRRKHYGRNKEQDGRHIAGGQPDAAAITAASGQETVRETGQAEAPAVKKAVQPAEKKLLPVQRERKETERTFSTESKTEAMARMEAYADEMLKSISERADAFRKELEKRFGNYRASAQTGASEDYRTPPAVRAVENAVIGGKTVQPKSQKGPEVGTSYGTQRRPDKTAKGERAPISDEEREARKEASRRANAIHAEKLRTLQRLADEVAEELPREFFEKLSGGIALTERIKKHPQSDPSKPLLVLGEYINDPVLGRRIVLYGGSILRVYGKLPEPALKKEVRRIIRHEFTHHIESLSGERGLEIKDEIRLENYKEELAGGAAGTDGDQ